MLTFTGGYLDDLGDPEQVESMQAQGVADYQFENVLERYASQAWAGGEGEGLPDWLGSSNNNATNAFAAVNAAFGNWTGRMTGATENINTQFYNQLGGLKIDDGGYLEASSAALEKMTQNVDEATRLLGQKQNTIRTIGDLHKVYKKDKQKRERAIKALEMETPETGQTISYRDPLTGKRVTHNVGGEFSAENRMGVRNTDAYGQAREWIANRINQQQEAYHDMVLTEDWIRDNQMSDWQSREWGGQTQYLLNTNPTTDQETWGTYEEMLNLQTSRNSNTDQWSHIALNEFFGGNDITLKFFRNQNDEMDVSSQAWSTTQNLYDAFASIASSTYGNLYDAGFNTVGQSMLASELTGKSVQDAEETMTAQSFKAQDQQKALRKSLKQANELFQKTKGKLRKNDKQPKARFGGFRKDTPA
tara:strand:- start:3514 stop:4767 length:1254 start_codon:yes stop_codon:yes gene_type:complete